MEVTIPSLGQGWWPWPCLNLEPAALSLIHLKAMSPELNVFRLDLADCGGGGWSRPAGWLVWWRGRLVGLAKWRTRRMCLMSGFSAKRGLIKLDMGLSKKGLELRKCKR